MTWTGPEGHSGGRGPLGCKRPPLVREPQVGPGLPHLPMAHVATGHLRVQPEARATPTPTPWSSGAGRRFAQSHQLANKVLQPGREMLAWSRLPPRDLRHTAATLLIAEGSQPLAGGRDPGPCRHPHDRPHLRTPVRKRPGPGTGEPTGSRGRRRRASPAPATTHRVARLAVAPGNAPSRIELEVHAAPRAQSKTPQMDQRRWWHRV